MSKRALRNPFWVTPKGSAVHHTEKQFSAYPARHPGRILPEQAAREADIEGAYDGNQDVAPGYSIRPVYVESKGQAGKSLTYRVFKGKTDTGKYALDRRKAAVISHRLAGTGARANPRYPNALARARAVEAAYDARTSGGASHRQMLARARAAERAFNLDQARAQSKVPYKAALAKAHRAEQAYNQRTADPNRAVMLAHARGLEQNYNEDQEENSGYVPYQNALIQAYTAEQAYDQSTADPNRDAILAHAQALSEQYDVEYADDNPAATAYVKLQGGMLSPAVTLSQIRALNAQGRLQAGELARVTPYLLSITQNNPVWIRPEGSKHARAMETAFDEAYDNPRVAKKALKYEGYSNSDLRKMAEVGDTLAAQVLAAKLLSHQVRMSKPEIKVSAPRAPRVRAPKAPSAGSLNKVRRAAAVAAEAEIFNLLRNKYGDAAARSISESMYEFAYDKGQLAFTLASSAYTAHQVDDPQVIKKMREIGKKYADAGVLVTVAVKNPRY